MSRSVVDHVACVAFESVALCSVVDHFACLAAAIRQGVPTYLYVYPGHAHGNWTLESHLMRANADLAWMEHYVNGREWAWEEPPVTYTEQPTAAWNPVKLQAKRQAKL